MQLAEQDDGVLVCSQCFVVLFGHSEDVGHAAMRQCGLHPDAQVIALLL